ncbi:hypothetical protein DENSPDRAFT_838505 [Dentipellis sp. KUC8613]|nr:hypothetical protein DENSPDRAFT_838505 [Dentipellis sp. KUC8613]
MSSNANQQTSNAGAEQTNTPQPSKMTGQFHSVKGTVVEMIGDATGATSWQTSGREEHLRGEREIQDAQAREYANGLVDRAEGKVDTVVGALTDDRQRQQMGNVKHDMGKAQQERNAPQ